MKDSGMMANNMDRESIYSLMENTGLDYGN